MGVARLCVVIAFGAAFTARAEPSHLVRLATVAPEGTAYARTIHAIQREVDQETAGGLTIKLYFGGIAGDDVSAATRIQKQQLDGVIASTLCESLSPSIRVMHLLGLYRDREEWSFVLNRLRPIFDQEMAQSGYVNLGEAALGATVILTRRAVHNLTELRRLKVWTWDTDNVKRLMLPLMGFHPVPLPLERAERSYINGEIDGFLSVPSAMLAFQWSTHGGYLEALPIDHLAVCIVVAQRAFDLLPVPYQRVMRASVAKGLVNFENVARDQDAQLLGGLFQRQGVLSVPVSAEFHGEFIESARRARERLGDKLVPWALLDRVLTAIDEFRAHHEGAARQR